MVRQTCRTMNSAPPTATLESAVFVAGVGAVDPVAYAELRTSGAGMCQLGVAACRAEWSGSRCRTWRALAN
jgi:hypothetical protein